MNCIYKNLVKTIMPCENIKNGHIQNRMLELFNLTLYDINYMIFKFYDGKEEICGIDNSFYSKFDIESIKDVVIYDKLEENTKGVDIVKLREIFNTFMIAENNSENIVTFNNLHYLIIQIVLTRIQVEEPNIETEDVKILVSEDDFKTLKEIGVKDEKCSVCLDDIDTRAMVLPCKHVYHKECIKEWLCNHSHKCPVCKNETFKGVPKLD